MAAPDPDHYGADGDAIVTALAASLVTQGGMECFAFCR
jgi:hypothetical protein